MISNFEKIRFDMHSEYTHRISVPQAFWSRRYAIKDRLTDNLSLLSNKIRIQITAILFIICFLKNYKKKPLFILGITYATVQQRCKINYISWKKYLGETFRKLYKSFVDFSLSIQRRI